MTKVCTKCEKMKPWAEFYIAKATQKPASACKECMSYAALPPEEKARKLARRQEIRANRTEEEQAVHAAKRRAFKLKYTYGLTVEQYDKMLDAQHGLCSICANPPEEGKYLSVDHDHSCCAGAKSCGKCVRELLCPKCNAGIGALGDDPVLLENAIAYLERTNGC
jgi:hypothetical protein